MSAVVSGYMVTAVTWSTLQGGKKSFTRATTLLQTTPFKHSSDGRTLTFPVFFAEFCGNLCVLLRPQMRNPPPNLRATDKRIYFVVGSSFPPTQTKSKVFFFLSSFPPKNNSSSPTSDSPLAKTRNYCFLPYTATAVQQSRQGRAHFSKKNPLSSLSKKPYYVSFSHFYLPPAIFSQTVFNCPRNNKDFRGCFEGKLSILISFFDIPLIDPSFIVYCFRQGHFEK